MKRIKLDTQLNISFAVVLFGFVPEQNNEPGLYRLRQLRQIMQGGLTSLIQSVKTRLIN